MCQWGLVPSHVIALTTYMRGPTMTLARPLIGPRQRTLIGGAGSIDKVSAGPKCFWAPNI